jgi:hypothetical protein
MDKFLKIYKNYYNKNKSYKISLDKIHDKHDNYYTKHSKLLIDFLDRTFKTHLKDKYVITFKPVGNEIIFHPKDSIKENFILKIILSKDELSSIPSNYVNYKILLNNKQYEDAEVLLIIGKISYLFSKKSNYILTKINQFQKSYNEYLKVKLYPQFQRNFKKVDTNKEKFRNQTLNLLLNSSFSSSPTSSFILAYKTHYFQTIIKIQANKLDLKGENYNILLTTNTKGEDNNFIEYTFKTSDILNFTENSLIPSLVNYIHRNNLVPSE